VTQSRPRLTQPGGTGNGPAMPHGDGPSDRWSAALTIHVHLTSCVWRVGYAIALRDEAALRRWLASMRLCLEELEARL
jgi:hypothetical protein